MELFSYEPQVWRYKLLFSDLNKVIKTDKRCFTFSLSRTSSHCETSKNCKLVCSLCVWDQLIRAVGSAHQTRKDGACSTVRTSGFCERLIGNIVNWLDVHRHPDDSHKEMASRKTLVAFVIWSSNNTGDSKHMICQQTWLSAVSYSLLHWEEKEKCDTPVTAELTAEFRSPYSKKIPNQNMQAFVKVLWINSSTLEPWILYVYVRERIQEFLDWPPGARTANGTALCH